MKNLRKLTAVVTAVVLAAMLLAVSVAAASAPKAKLNKTTITISVGETYYLYVNGAVDSISWSSSDKSVATVSKGKVTGKSVGTAVIIAKHGSTSLSCTVEVKKKGESGKVTIAKYLFDDKPYMYEHILLATRNSDFLNAEEANNYWHYYDVDATTKMPSGGKEYKKGMNLVADSSYTAGIYYNLEGKYSKLVGKIAFCDWSMDRVDKSYTILFYGDDKLLKSYTINKGDLPINISVDLKNCKKLKIEFVRPSGDNTKNPNINLIEFGLVI